MDITKETKLGEVFSGRTVEHLNVLNRDGINPEEFFRLLLVSHRENERAKYCKDNRQLPELRRENFGSLEKNEASKKYHYSHE